MSKGISKGIIGGVISGMALIGGLLVGAMFVERVEVGNVGVVYNLDGVEETPLPQGWHVLAPFDKVIEYPTRTKTQNFDAIRVATSDGKNIDIDIAFNYNVDPTKAVDLYNKFGAVTVDDIADSYLRTRLRDAARKTISKYSVIDIYGEKSSEAQAAIQTAFASDVESLGFNVEGLMLGVPQADSATQEAIDSRVKASQELEKTQTELKIAEANAKKLIVEAEAQAKANRIVSESLTDRMLQQQTIEKWNGILPTVTGSDSMMISLPSSAK